MRYVVENYPSWPNEIARVALGVVLMSLTNDITSKGLVHFLHLAQGGVYLRSHYGKTFLYGNGAFRLSNGVMPESVLQRCKDYDSYVEGILWRIGERCESRNGEDIFADVGSMFRAITTCVRRGGDGDTQSEAGGVRAGTRGGKRKRT